MLFFKVGFSKAVFKSDGNIPVLRERLTISSTSSDTESKIALKNLVGMGSREQVDDLRLETTLHSVTMSTGLKEHINVLCREGGSSVEMMGLCFEMFCRI